MTNPETGVKTLLNNGLAHGQGQKHDHDHDDHRHDGDDVPHVHGPSGEIISLEAAVLGKNDKIAAQNRGWFQGRGVIALNIVSSPGSGKTTLLEATVRQMKDEVEITVIEGDQMTANDAERIQQAGARAIQINTGAGCHLEADMIAAAAKSLNPQPGSIMMIENVGNLVCPAMFDLGEKMKIAVISTTEGEDKPIKYPHMFRAVEWVVINKMDLAPHVDFDEETCRKNILQVNPNVKIFCLSARTGDGMDEWCAALRALQA
tara:strand:- start:2935 stop:3717 length:783 start_codon:yes stop_codon:yes gene_type:complete